MNAAQLQGVKQCAEPAIGLEGQHPLFQPEAELLRHGDARREGNFDAVVGEVELRDAAFDVTARAAINRGALWKRMWRQFLNPMQKCDVGG